MRRKPETPGWMLAAGILLIICGLPRIISGEGGYYNLAGIWPLPLVDWIGWVLLPFGIVTCIVAIRLLRRGEGKSPKYSDEEIARAKEELDRIYCEEHDATKSGLPGAKFLAVVCIALTLSLIVIQLVRHLAAK